MQTGYVPALFEDPINTQIRDYRIAVIQISKANIDVAISDAVFTRIIASVIYDVIENEIFSIKIKGNIFHFELAEV
mgnify:CR=1 FL=1